MSASANNSSPMVIEILLVDDDPGDVLLTTKALRQCDLADHLTIAGDGVEALEFLRRHAATLPDVILLDLDMPRMDGRETLSRIKSDARLRAIPIVILSSSQSPQDVALACDLEASSYINKPIDLETLLRVVRSIHHAD